MDFSTADWKSLTRQLADFAIAYDAKRKAQEADPALADDDFCSCEIAFTGHCSACRADDLV